MRLLTLIVSTLIMVVFALAPNVQARAKHTFKIASLAPEGSVWVNQFKEFAAEVTEKTGGEVAFRIYPGGVMGDDVAMYRKMRVGQLHGGGFTMTGISTVVPDFRVMAIPFYFNNYQEIDAVSAGLTPLFTDQFRKKGMELIAMTEVGFIYTMSTKPITNASDLRKSTSWIPAGDPLASEFLENLNITPVQLAIPDVTSSLQTGLIDTVYNSLYGSIVMQWFSKATYITDIPFAYAYGVFLIDKRKFDKLSKEHAKVLQDAAKTHFAVLMDATRQSNAESREVLEQQGVNFVKADKASVQELAQYREKTVNALVGKSFSREIYDASEKILNAYRQQHGQGSKQ